VRRLCINEGTPVLQEHQLCGQIIVLHPFYVESNPSREEWVLYNFPQYDRHRPRLGVPSLSAVRRLAAIKADKHLVDLGVIVSGNTHHHRLIAKNSLCQLGKISLKIPKEQPSNYSGWIRVQ